MTGLVTTVLGADVLISDVKDFIPLIQENIRLNKSQLTNGKVEALEVDWRQFCQEEDPENAMPIDMELRSKLLNKLDYILVSDCIYYERK